MDAIDKEIQELRAEWKEHERRLTEITRRIREICKHEWVWSPIAGEGQYCLKCGAVNYDCDD